jgi:hypothetical protein
MAKLRFTGFCFKPAFHAIRLKTLKISDRTLPATLLSRTPRFKVSDRAGKPISPPQSLSIR